MRLNIFLLILIMNSSYLHAQNEEIITNETIIKLHKAGFSKEILKSKIQTSVSKFDMSVDGMMNLKKAGIADDVINIMIAKPAQDETVNIPNKNSLSQKNSIKKVNLRSGIYYKSPASEFIEIEPSNLTGVKEDRAAQVILGGIFNASAKASLSDKQSSFVIYESSPTIIFVFDTTERSSLNNDNNHWWTNVRSPKEFLLVKLKVNEKENSREILIGKGNVLGGKLGIDDKAVTRFTSKKLYSGFYEVVPDSPLEEGEYCIMFASGVKKGENNKLFDFSVKKSKLL